MLFNSAAPGGGWRWLGWSGARMVDTIDTLQRLPPPGPGRRTPASSADTSQSASVILTLSPSSYDVPAVATLQPRPHHDGGGLRRPPPAVPPRAAPPRPRPRPRDQRRPRQEEEDRRQVSRAGGDAREAGVGYKHTIKIAFMLLY